MSPHDHVLATGQLTYETGQAGIAPYVPLISMTSPDHPPIPLYKPPTAPDGALATVRGIWTGTGIEVDTIEVAQSEPDPKDTATNRNVRSRPMDPDAVSALANLGRNGQILKFKPASDVDFRILAHDCDDHLEALVRGSLPDSTSFELVESIWSAAELMAADTALIRVPHTYAIGTRVGSDLQFRKHIDVFEVSPELDDALRHSPSGLIEPTVFLTVER